MTTETSICDRCKVALVGPQELSTLCAVLFLNRDENPQVIRFTLCLDCNNEIGNYIRERGHRQEAERENARQWIH